MIWSGHADLKLRVNGQGISTADGYSYVCLEILLCQVSRCKPRRNRRQTCRAQSVRRGLAFIRMQVQPAIKDPRLLVNPKGGSFPWLMRFPEHSFDPVGRANVVPPAAIERSWSSWPGRLVKVSPMKLVSTVARRTILYHERLAEDEEGSNG